MMPEWVFREFLEDIFGYVMDSTRFGEELDERGFTGFITRALPDEPYHSWVMAWKRGEYPVYLQELFKGARHAEDSDDLEA